MSKAFEPYTAMDETSNDMDVGALAAAVYARKYSVLLPTLLIFLAAALYVTIARPRYSADTQILLENQESYITRALRNEQGGEQPPTIDENWVGSQIALITSRDVAREVVEKLGLVGNAELDPLAKGLGSIQRTLVLFGLIRNPMRLTAEERTIDTFQQRLSAYAPPKTQVVSIDFWAHDPVFAARVANEVAAIYLERQANAKRDVARNAAAALAEQIADLKVKVTHAADDVERYRASTGLLAGSNNMTITTQQLADLNTDLSHARTEEADSQAKASLIRQLIRQGRVSEIPDVANNDLIRRIAEQRVTANAQLALEAGTLLPQHPRIRELKAEIADLDSQLRLAADNIAVSLENDSKIAAARVANIQAAIDQQKQVVTAADTNGVHLHELEQIAQTYREQLDSASAKYEEALSRQSSATPADARVIAAASPPDQPSFPKKPQILALATLATFVFSLAAVAGRELLSDRPAPVYPHDYEPLRLVDERPRGKRAAFDRFKHFASARVAESMEVPAPDQKPETLADKAASSQGLNIVATRLSKSEAATDALIGFVRNLARDGRPIIVDLDSHNGQIAKLIGQQGDEETISGLTDLLDGKASLEEVIHRDSASRLHFVPFGSKDDINPDDLDVILDALSQTYDFVVLAAPPFPGSPMTKALVPFADFVVLATPGVREDAATQARDELNAAGAAEVLFIDGAKEAA